jgi:Ca-activated chloride channel family protein
MKALLIALIPALLVSAVSAVDTGYIFGTVVDAATGSPLPYANVVVVGTKLGGMTLADGSFSIYGVPAGTYIVKVMMMGYKPATKEGVRVVASKGTKVEFAMKEHIVGRTQEIVVSAEQCQIDVKSTDVQARITKKDELKELPIDDVVEAIALKGGIVRTGDELHVRGGRSGSVQFQIDGIPAHDPLGGSGRGHRHKKHPKKPPCRPKLVCIQQRPYHNTEEYAPIEENDFLPVIGNPLSTFSIDVDAASYANVRRFIMEDRLPPRDAVRVEEFINYFDYDYEKPEDEVPFSINLEYAVCPWNEEHTLVHIGLQGEELDEEDRRPSNLVFLIDVSGSMRPENKLPLLKKAFLLLADQLADDDQVAIVTYAGEAQVPLNPTPGYKRNEIKYAIGRLHAGGSTAGYSGIQMAYGLAVESFIPGGNNRVILATDGDFNVGVSSTSELVEMIEEKRELGIFLTVLGFGMGNYKDGRLEQIADKGNGNHAYIDNLLEAKKVFVDDLTSTLYTIAKDVKIQVEFNPVKVASYRLIGYENRMLKKEDFADDRKDAGEIGAGHSVTALYEIVPIYYGDAGGKDGATHDMDVGGAGTAPESGMPVGNGMKYVETRLSQAAYGDEVVTVHVRYKKPEGDTSRLITKVIAGEPVEVMEASDDLRFASAVTMYAMILRESTHMRGVGLDYVKDLAKGARGDDENGYRAEFIRQVERTELIVGLANR